MNLGTPIAEGNTANVYLYEDRIVKVFKEHLPTWVATYEADKQKYVYSCGLPVPEILDVTNIDGKPAIIMEYTQGRTIGELATENIERAEYYMDISVDIQQKIHKIAANSLEPMAEKLTRQIESAPLLTKKQKSFLIQKLNGMTFEKRLCHGDYHLYNLIMSDHNVTIIDWVDSSAGDIRADVYRTYLLYSQHSVELADLYLRLYCEKSGMSKDEVFQWAPIIAGARLSEHVSSESADRLVAIVNQYCP